MIADSDAVMDALAGAAPGVRVVGATRDHIEVRVEGVLFEPVVDEIHEAGAEVCYVEADGHGALVHLRPREGC